MILHTQEFGFTIDLNSNSRGSESFLKSCLPTSDPSGHAIRLPVLSVIPVLSCSAVSDPLTPHRLSSISLLCPWGFSRQRYWWVACPPPGDIPNSENESRSHALQADSLPSEPPGKPQNTGAGSLSLLQGIFLTQELNWSLCIAGGFFTSCAIREAGCYTCIIEKIEQVKISVSDHKICKCMRKYEVFLKIL